MCFSYFLLWFTKSIITPNNISSDSFNQLFTDISSKFNSSLLASWAISINYKGQNIFEYVDGYSNVGNNLITNQETLYPWSSISSLLTHVSIMQLYEEGKLNLHDDITKYLGKNFFKRLTYIDPIRIINLMNHDTGWDMTAEDSIIPGNRISVNLEDVILKNEPRQFCKPGTFVSYSDFGVAVEGLIIEKVSKINYIEYVKKNILSKLGMNNTSIDPLRTDISEDQLSKLAIPYEIKTKKGISKLQETKFYSNQFYPSGSAISTITDLSIFANALVGKNNQSYLVKYNSTLLEFYKLTKENPNISHGLFQQYYSGRIIGFDLQGNTMGFTSFISLLPEEGFSYVGISNLQNDLFISRAFHHELWGLYTQTTNLSIPYELAGDYVSTNIIHRGFFKRQYYDKYFSKQILENKQQFLFNGEVFRIAEKNLFTNIVPSNGVYISNYQISFTFDKDSNVIGFCNFDNCYEIFDGSNDIKLHTIPSVLMFICSFFAIMYMETIHHFFSKSKEKPAYKKYAIINIIIFIHMVIIFILALIGIVRNRIGSRKLVISIINYLIFLHIFIAFLIILIILFVIEDIFMVTKRLQNLLHKTSNRVKAEDDFDNNTELININNNINMETDINSINENVASMDRTNESEKSEYLDGGLMIAICLTPLLICFLAIELISEVFWL